MTYVEYLRRVGNHLSVFFTDPMARAAVWQVWLNRDFTKWGEYNGREITLPTWQPSEKLTMYLRKDVAAQIWNYGVGPSTTQIEKDPYEGKETPLTADILLGGPGTEPGLFQRPRDVAVAPDGSLYIADTENNRIQHLARDGSVLHSWGSFADITQGEAPPGTFFQPWGLAIAPDGSVYVADTWNYRIQKFTPDGKFVAMWGYAGQGEAPEAFWGPRDVEVDQQGRVLVSDTGNKRIVIFGPDGEYISQFGSEGFEPGQFYESIGISLDQQGNLYVADTWNQRVQVFAQDDQGGYQPLNAWDVYAWFGQSLDNKPYLDVAENGHVFVTDPEGYRVLEFTRDGQIVRFWGDYSTGPDGFGLAAGVAVDPQGGIWVTDAGNSRIMHFNLPEE
jgi:DNA-binding beta-propeller fold protein YncE